ncbi:MAG: PolC-type DNA polymerase III [Myxococcota bacterium]
MEATASILRRLCFVDIETTGLDPTTDVILEIGAVFVEDGVVTSRKSWLVQPERPIPALITALTGLTDEDVKAADHLATIDPRVRDALAGWTLVAHNAAFERSFLGERIAANPMLDSCELAQLLFPERPSHSLDSLVRWLEVGRGARHRALDDAEDTFLVLAALCDRVLGEVDRGRLERLTHHLRPGTSRDRLALLAFLDALAAAPRPDGPRVPVATLPGVPDDARRLQHQLASWLRSPTFVAAELERDPLLPLALAAARELEEPVALAVTGSTFREYAALVPAIPRSAVCSTALRAALRELGPSETSQFGRAWLTSWLERTPTGALEGLSHFMRSRSPELVELLASARRCTCDDAGCHARRAQRELPVVMITHEHALDWLERGVPARMVVLDADRLPEAERRRSERALWVDELERLGLDVAELTEALAAMPAGPVGMRVRVTPPWLAVREAMTQLSHALRALPVTTERTRLLGRIAEVLEPPPPGFETIVVPEGLVRQPTRVAERLLRRLRGGTVLVSTWRGGLAWTRVNALSHAASKRDARLEWVAEPASLEQLTAMLAREAPVVLVAPSPLAPLAEACARRGLSISLDAERRSAVHLAEWRRDRPAPEGQTCVFYGVKEWRRAVLASRAPRVLLLSPTGLPPEPLRRALRGFDPKPVTC